MGKNATIKRAFQLFCTKAHYYQNVSSASVNKKVKEDLHELLVNQNVGISYDAILDIDEVEATRIGRECMHQNATMTEKFELNKFYFKRSFNFTFAAGGEGYTTEQVSKLADSWDDKLNAFYSRLGEVLARPRHLFRLIAEENKLPGLFPVDVKKMKLGEETKKIVFSLFAFKYLTPSSSVPKILKEIYNVFFQAPVITTKYDNDKNQHVIYEVMEGHIEHYEFAKEYYILDKVHHASYVDIEAEAEREEAAQNTPSILIALRVGWVQNEYHMRYE